MALFKISVFSFAILLSYSSFFSHFCLLLLILVVCPFCNVSTNDIRIKMLKDIAVCLICITYFDPLTNSCIFFSASPLTFLFYLAFFLPFYCWSFYIFFKFFSRILSIQCWPILFQQIFNTQLIYTYIFISFTTHVSRCVCVCVLIFCAKAKPMSFAYL